MAFSTSKSIGEVDRAPVIALAWLFIIFWSCSTACFWPFHQISAPYRAVDYTAAICTLLTNPEASL